MQIRRVVTGYDDQGSPTILSDGPAPATVDLPTAVGAALVDLWRSDSVPMSTTGCNDPTEAEFALMPSGSLFRIIDLAPGEHAPMWHTTASVDFIYVVSGTVAMRFAEPGSGEDPEPSGEVTLSAGDTIVQRGIHHTWVNTGPDVCRLVNVSVAAALPLGVEPG